MKPVKTRRNGAYTSQILCKEMVSSNILKLLGHLYTSSLPPHPTELDQGKHSYLIVQPHLHWEFHFEKPAIK